MCGHWPALINCASYVFYAVSWYILSVGLQSNAGVDLPSHAACGFAMLIEFCCMKCVLVVLYLFLNICHCFVSCFTHSVTNGSASCCICIKCRLELSRLGGLYHVAGPAGAATTRQKCHGHPWSSEGNERELGWSSQ